MPRSDRLFELIQLLRAAKGPRTADTLAEELEVSPRTIYRDVTALQAMRVPVEGAAGLGYVLRSGYDLPPLNFDEEEVEALRKGNEASSAGFRIVSKTLAESKIRKGKLIHQGRVLTSERLHELISQAALAKDAIALHTIAAAGDQACDCHNAGSGPIPANALIVVDIFPRRPEDGYWGDMTRTFLKGKASDAQKKLVRTVSKLDQEKAFAYAEGIIDGLFQFSRPISGSYFWCPPVKDGSLDLSAIGL